MDDTRLSMDVSATQAAMYYPVLIGGYLRIQGEDRIAFLQRQTTNDLHLLRPGRAVLTVLTTPTARILDVLYVTPQVEALGVLTLPGRRESTARYLKSRIFFMDKVTVMDASAEIAQFDLIGPGASITLRQFGIEPALQPNQFAQGAYEGASLQALALEPAFGLGVRLLLPVEVAEAWQAHFAATGVARLSEEEYSLLRIEAGLPAADAELSEEYTPLEVGLEVAVSETKGCYTGQEVLARQVTYDKVTQRLCGLRLERRARPGARIWAADGSPVGKVTSTATSPRFGEIALGVVKRPYHEPGTMLRVGETFDLAGESRAAALPFRAS